MEIEIVWTNRAEKGLSKTIEYLKSNWTKKEIVRFAERTEVIIRVICKNPNIFPASIKHKSIRKAAIDKNNSFFYQVDSVNRIIYILTFYENRQNPQKLIL